MTQTINKKVKFVGGYYNKLPDNHVQHVIEGLNTGLSIGQLILDGLTLQRQPTNKHDPNAVGVYFFGALAGHLSREDAATVAPLMDDGYHVTITSTLPVDPPKCFIERLQYEHFFDHMTLTLEALNLFKVVPEERASLLDGYSSNPLYGSIYSGVRNNSPCNYGHVLGYDAPLISISDEHEASKEERASVEKYMAEAEEHDAAVEKYIASEHFIAAMKAATAEMYKLGGHVHDECDRTSDAEYFRSKLDAKDEPKKEDFFDMLNDVIKKNK